MKYYITPSKDATIYDQNYYTNTGCDSIIELEKLIADSDSAFVQNSRILMKFDLSEISESLANGIITAPKYYLNLYTAEAKEISAEYDLEIAAVSQSWEMGIGKKYNDPKTKEGVSWIYRDGYTPATIWTTASLATGSAEHHIGVYGGGTWYTASIASYSYEYESTDVRIEVTNIVNRWISGTLGNDGFIIKRTDADEDSSAELGTLQFFSRDSHTIYIPKLEVAWDDSSYVSGSLTLLTNDDDYIVYQKNLRSEYNENERAKIRIIGRDRFPIKTYVTSSDYTTITYRLPSTTYYSIKDAHSEETLIPFDTTYTKVSCDSNGNYFNLWLNAFQSERNYRVILKVVSGSTIRYFDNDMFFKVIR